MEDVKEWLLQVLDNSSPMSRKELKKFVSMERKASKPLVKPALKSLLKMGKVEKMGKFYAVKKVSVRLGKDATADDHDDDVDKALPIAAQMRMKANSSTTTEEKKLQFCEQEMDIDDEIERLERELAAAASSDESNSDEEGDEKGPGVLSLSKFASDHVEQLPVACLPVAGKYNSTPRSDSATRGKKRKVTDKQQEDTTVSNGLREAVQEILSGYKARSSERLPFYCRFCAKQYTTERSFLDHKSFDLHKTAVAMERKATYCRLCRKQLTSPAQMSEHLQSRPHKEKLRQTKERQSGHKRNRNGDLSRQWS